MPVCIRFFRGFVDGICYHEKRGLARGGRGWAHALRARDVPRPRRFYAQVIYEDPDATLEDLHEAVSTLEETAQTAGRVFGRAHPITPAIERDLKKSRVALRARESWWPFIVCAFAIVYLAWMCWKFGLGAMVFTFAVIVFVPRVINE